VPAEDAPTKLCFVIGPIGDSGTDIRRHADWLLRGIIKPVFATDFPDFKVERADEIVAPGSINAQVINRLMDAPLVIADMSQHNANAFYELAIRHMVRLPTIHMIQKAWKIPFDVAPYRAIPFSYDDFDGLEAARVDLKTAVEEVTKPGFIVENPVTHARARFEIDQHATPAMRAIADEVALLRSGLDQQKRSVGALAWLLRRGTSSAPPSFVAGGMLATDPPLPHTTISAAELGKRNREDEEGQAPSS
jgi:hypothetical protein